LRCPSRIAGSCATVLHMNRVGVRELRHNLSAWLRRVRDGEAFEVTDRGEPVGVLAPLPRESDPIVLLERRGQVARRGDGASFDLPTLRSPRSTEELLDELREDKV
jgi:prevent-host-death family protein